MSVHGSVPSAVVSLVRKIEQVNIRGGNFYIDFEFVSLGRFREDESQIQRFPVEIAVRRLDGQVVIDTPIKYDKSIPEFLAGIPRTGSTANYSWAVMRKVYGQEEETFGESWDEVRHLLHDAGMEKDSYVVEWSNSGIDYIFLKMIMQQHIPSNSILLIHFWRTLLSGFSSMKLSYSYAFLYPDSSIHEHAHQASFDSLMFVEAMRALIDLAHRDDPRAEEFGTGELRIDEQTFRLQEQLEVEYDKDDQSDDGQSGKDVDSLEAQIAHEEAIEAMTDEEKELADLFLKSFGTLPSVDSIFGPTNSSSVRERDS